MSAERLSDSELESLQYHGCSSGTSTAPMVRDAIVKACTELQQRRAADLTPDELDLFKEAVESDAPEFDVIANAISKVLQAHGVDS